MGRTSWLSSISEHDMISPTKAEFEDFVYLFEKAELYGVLQFKLQHSLIL
jgi:hypothetical protein